MPDEENATCGIHAIAQLRDAKSKYYNEAITIINAKAMFIDMIGASIITTSAMLYALVNILINNLAVLKRLHNEVDAVAGMCLDLEWYILYVCYFSTVGTVNKFE